ncbi:MAG: hypothetical protein OEZ06_11350 [Myxococcales bacterium]|nr:hypothetical protein [Myxococcales bacterium]
MARPARLSPAHRQLFVRMSQGEPMAWLASLEVEAYALAERSSPDGPGARISLLWVRGPRRQVREALQRGSGLDLRWGDLDCGVGGCRRVVATFVDESIVRIERGRFPSRPPRGAEARCAALARDHPGALELAARRSRRMVRAGSLGLPLRSTTVVEPSARGLLLQRIDMMSGLEAAANALSGELGRRLAERPRGRLGTELERKVVGDELRVVREVRWQDLELARDDELRLRDARREAEVVDRLTPLDEVDVNDREALLSAVGLRLERAAGAGGMIANTMFGEARTLLERGLTRFPEDQGLALLLTELLLQSKDSAARALELAERFAERPGAASSWKLRRRHAAAQLDEASLARHLVSDGLVSRGTARKVARAIREAMTQGQDYERAERRALVLAK